MISSMILNEVINKIQAKIKCFVPYWTTNEKCIFSSATEISMAYDYEKVGT